MKIEEKKIKKEKLKKPSFLDPKKCVYCGENIKWGLTCKICGLKEDRALGKIN